MFRTVSMMGDDEEERESCVKVGLEEVDWIKYILLNQIMINTYFQQTHHYKYQRCNKCLHQKSNLLNKCPTETINNFMATPRCSLEKNTASIKTSKLNKNFD